MQKAPGLAVTSGKIQLPRHRMALWDIELLRRYIQAGDPDKRRVPDDLGILDRVAYRIVLKLQPEIKANLALFDILYHRSPNRYGRQLQHGVSIGRPDGFA
jgi:hypothetical protein